MSDASRTEASAALETLVEGAYQLYFDGRPSGTERWRIVRREGGYAAEGEQANEPPFPYPNTQRYAVELSPDWRVMALTVDWVVQERTLRAIHRAQGESWTGRIEYEGKSREQEGNYPLSAEVDFGSHLFNTFALLRRGLGPGTDEEFPVLFIGPPFMAAAPGRLRYRFVEKGTVETPAGSFEGWRWLVTHAEREDDEGYTFWSDAQGTVLESYDGPRAGRVWMKLVEYRRGGGS